MSPNFSEMRRKQDEERLLKIKEPFSPSKSVPKVMAKSGAVGGTSKDHHNPEEKRLLQSLNVESSERDAYTKRLIGEDHEDEEDSVVYGSSAPGFVRSNRSANVVEVAKSKDDDDLDDVTPLDECIAVKLENTESEADVLTEAELRAIQERLARDTSALIAERGKHDRIAATVSDQMYADCQELLQMFGIPWVVAPSEAEAQCAFFDLVGMTDGSVTDDSDVWLFGGQTVFKVKSLIWALCTGFATIICWHSFRSSSMRAYP